MLGERDPDVELRALRQARDTRNRHDTQTLMNAWRAIARSHRLLDREIYSPCDGELDAPRMGMAGTGRADSGNTGTGQISRRPHRGQFQPLLWSAPIAPDKIQQRL